MKNQRNKKEKKAERQKKNKTKRDEDKNKEMKRNEKCYNKAVGYNDSHWSLADSSCLMLENKNKLTRI